jgi:hypothetical protein
MKIASGILSLILGLMISLQSCAVGIGGSILDEESATQGGSVGFFVALLFFIGGAFSFALPKVSMVVMIIAGFLGIAAGSTTVYSDMTVWGVVALILAVLNYFGSREKKKKEDTTTAPPTP